MFAFPLAIQYHIIIYSLLFLLFTTCTMENTRDLSQFGYIELKKAAKLLTMYTNEQITKLWKEFFWHSGVSIEFNQDSWNVFLIDDDYNVLMKKWDELDLFLSTPYDWHEGFYDELMEKYDELHQEDKDFLDSFKD